MNKFGLTFVLILSGVFSLGSYAQDSNDADSDVEEVVTVGSQIKGASITGALPVTVLSTEDIDALGITSGDELLESLPEMGQNFFNEQETMSGAINASRGDSGAYNLRSMGVGNTLVLLNGRRMVNGAGYQTELIGGDYVATLSVNSNTIPTAGLDRLEILKDGASAIYGADAVAGSSSAYAQGWRARASKLLEDQPAQRLISAVDAEDTDRSFRS